MASSETGENIVLIVETPVVSFPCYFLEFKIVLALLTSKQITT